MHFRREKTIYCHYYSCQTRGAIFNRKFCQKLFKVINIEAKKTGSDNFLVVSRYSNSLNVLKLAPLNQQVAKNTFKNSLRSTPMLSRCNNEALLQYAYITACQSEVVRAREEPDGEEKGLRARDELRKTQKNSK